jgi:hypothetical protein
MNNSILIKKLGIFLIYAILLLFLKNNIKDIKLLFLMSLIILSAYYNKYSNNKKDLLILIIITFITLSRHHIFLEKINNIINNYKNVLNNNQINYNYNKILIDEQSNKLLKLALADPELKKNIRLKSVEAYGIINNNPSLRNFFIFNNLIDSEGLPIFINHDMPEEIILSNEIKITLILSELLKK